jgi:hypothetical protein
MQCSAFNPSYPLSPNPHPEFHPIPETVARRVGQLETEQTPVLRFTTHFVGYMEMYGDCALVAAYLDAHEGWFCRCAQPMTVVPLGENGYVLTVGRFGSFGYEVEPKLAIVLHPPKHNLYLMQSVPLPDEPSLGYEVDYQARMELIEIPIAQASAGMEKAFRKQAANQTLPDVVTRVQWQLQMEVAVQFPKFIQRLPQSVVQSTGDRLLSQIVRQVSPRLTHKVQHDFHQGLDLPLPPKSSRSLQRVGIEEEDLERSA